MRVLGIDPSLTSFGIALADIDTETNNVEVVDLFLQKTKSGAKKKTIRVNVVDLERCRFIYDALHKMLKGVQVVFAEAPVGSQNASAMKSYGLSIMALASIQQPVIVVSPDEVKLSGAGRSGATKAEMINWATDLYPDAPWLRARGKSTGAIIADNEHLADAVAAIHAGIKTNEFRMAVMMAGRRAA